MRFRMICLLTLSSCIMTLSPAFAEIEWTEQKSIPLAASPLDTALSADGKSLFVLFPKGEVRVYASTGEPQEVLHLGGNPDGLVLSPRGDQLYLKDGKSGGIRIVSIAYRYDIDTAGAPSRGPEKAPVTVTIFSDFQCPYCAKLVPVLDQIEEAYPETVRIVFKNFPLRNHKFARQAAVAALAADAQGKFWPVHDKFFQNYSRLNELLIREIVTEAGLDMTRFDESLKKPQLAAQVDSDMREARRVGLTGTPTVYVNGRIAPSRSFEGLKRAIEEELAKKRTK